MYAQFFGNFLLNSKYISSAQLKKAIEVQNSTHLKLGTMAINAGYMTSKQVEKVHEMQQKEDQRFGNLAVKMGYMTDMAVSSLLNAQQPSFLILGQTIIDLGFMTNEQMEKAIESYKKKYSLSNDAISQNQSKTLDKIVEEFYHFGSSDLVKFCTSYVILLFNNLVRFIGSDFIPVEAACISFYKADNIVIQSLSGGVTADTGIEGSEKVLLEIARRFSGENIEKYDDYAKAAVSEFLNLHNGLFAVNMSNQNNIEISLTPQEAKNDYELSFSKNSFCIPFEYPFGIVNFILSE